MGDLTGYRYKDDKQASWCEPDEVDVPENAVPEIGAGHEPDHTCHSRQKKGSPTNELGQPAVGWSNLLLNHQTILRAQSVAGHQGRNIETIAVVRGDSAGRGVGLVEIALLFEIRHDVSDGGRGESLGVQLREGP